MLRPDGLHDGWVCADAGGDVVVDGGIVGGGEDGEGGGEGVEEGGDGEGAGGGGERGGGGVEGEEFAVEGCFFRN